MAANSETLAVLSVLISLAGNAPVNSSTADIDILIEELGQVLFFGSMQANSSTTDITLARLQALSGALGASSQSTDILVRIFRNLSGAIAADSITANIDLFLGNWRYFSGALAAETGTADAALNLHMALSGAATIDALAANAMARIYRELSGNATIVSWLSDLGFTSEQIAIIITTIARNFVYNELSASKVINQSHDADDYINTNLTAVNL
jgi:hypothetical protein